MKLSFQNNLSLSKLLPKTHETRSSHGTIQYIWTEREDKVKINILHYNEADFFEKELSDINESQSFNENKMTKWINITWVHNEEIIQEIWEQYKIHPLVLEDISNTTQRAKVEEYDDYLFVIIKMIYFSKKTSELVIEQVSLIVGDNYVISLQEKEDDVFDWVRQRIHKKKGRICKSWSDYLMYAIIDAVVDQYFTVMEKMSEKIEYLEEKLLISPDQKILHEIYSLKKELLFIKKSVWPIREVISLLNKTESAIINESTLIYLRDLYDHSIQVIETIENFRDLTSWILDLYLSTISNKMNEVMKVLTVFAAIFIPLTFIAWVYWMNFKFMPELEWKYAYPVWWSIIIILTIIMLILFKKKKWL